MKVLFINTLYYPNMIGGAEKSVQFLAESLVKSGHQAVVVSADNNKGIKVDNVNGVKVYYVGLKNLYWPFAARTNVIKKVIWHTIDSYNPFMASVIEKILINEKPDIVNTNNLAGFSVAVWPIIKKHEIPLVHTIRDYYLICPNTTMFKNGLNCAQQCLSCKTFSKLRKKYSRLVDITVGISQFILQKHMNMEYFPKSEDVVIHNSYERKITDISLDTSIPKVIVFGYIGRLSPEKGVNIVLEAFNSIKGGTSSLLIGGTGDEEYVNSLKLEGNSYVKYLGFVKPEEFYPQIDVLIVPSIWHEPLGRIVFEAYAYGVPVIGSNRGGIPEIIDNGETGYIFDPDDINSLVNLMTKVVNDHERLQIMARKCFEKAKAFLPSEILDKYVSLYQSLLK